MENSNVELQFTGEFSLAVSVNMAAKASFVEGFYGQNEELELACLIENSWKTVGVRIIQENKKLTARIYDNPSNATTEEIQKQLERMLSLNIDGKGFSEIIARDKVVSELDKLNPGLRPILFPSPYEGAARAIVGHQLPVKQAARINARICEEYGVRVEIDNHVKYGFPLPEKLSELPYITGLAARKVEQLRVLGSSVGNWLSSKSLLEMDREEAMIRLQKLPGIGPFSAELIMLRGVGDQDAFPKQEMRLQRAMSIAYQLGENPDLKSLEYIAENWRPYRTWVGLILRNSIPK
jgi:DNA-3-methyladenine glycosylase II